MSYDDETWYNDNNNNNNNGAYIAQFQNMIIALYKNTKYIYIQSIRPCIKQNKQNTLEHVGFQTMFKSTNGGRRSDGNGLLIPEGRSIDTEWSITNSSGTPWDDETSSINRWAEAFTRW